MSEQSESKTKAWYLKPKAIITAIAAVILLILIFQNWESVSVDLLFATDIQVPAALVYIFFAAAGFAAARITLRTKPKEGGSKSK